MGDSVGEPTIEQAKYQQTEFTGDYVIGWSAKYSTTTTVNANSVSSTTFRVYSGQTGTDRDIIAYAPTGYEIASFNGINVNSAICAVATMTYLGNGAGVLYQYSINVKLINPTSSSVSLTSTDTFYAYFTLIRCTNGVTH